MTIYSIGFIPGHHFTIIYTTRDNVVIEYKLIENSEFLFKITDILDYFIEKYFKKNKISFLSLYTGPAPLTTSRTISAWIQGWANSEKINVITLSNTEIWRREKSIPVIINLFAGKYIFLDEFEEKIINQVELEDRIKKFECISISKGVKIPSEYFLKKSAYTFLIPNFTFVGNARFEKFKNKDFTEIEKIKPIEIN